MSLRNWVSKSCSRTASDAPSTSERDSGCFITAAYVARSLVGSLSVLQRFWNISGLNKDCPSSQSDTVSFWRPSTSKGCKFERTVIMPMHGVCPLKKQGQVRHFGGLQLTRECTVYTLHQCVYTRAVSAQCKHYTHSHVCGGVLPLKTGQVNDVQNATCFLCGLRTCHVRSGKQLHACTFGGFPWRDSFAALARTVSLSTNNAVSGIRIAPLQGQIV